MQMFKVYSVKDARKIMLEAFKDFKVNTEEIDILDGRGKILAEDIYAKVDVPHFKRSTVDGYAVVSKDTQGASESLPVFLDLIGEVEMGKSSEFDITSDKAVYVPTGGMVPNGADSVVMVEYTERLDENSIAVYKSNGPKENITDIGEDIKKGEKVLSKGTVLRPQDIGVLAAIGIDRVNVFKMPTISVLSTGDEIIHPNEILKPGKIRDINTYTLSAMAESTGLEINRRLVVKDDFNLLKKSLQESLKESDIVVISGGSSVGTKDLTTRVINDLGKPGVLVHGIAVKPGKPSIIAKINDKPVFGLPGQPVSAMIIFKILVEYFVKEILQIKDWEDKFIEAISAVNIPSAQGRETYQMVDVKMQNGSYVAKPIHGKSGMISLISKAKGYIKIDENKEGVKEGEKVKVYLF